MPNGKIKAYADTAYMAKVYIGWARKLNLAMDLYVAFSDENYRDFLKPNSIKTHRLISKGLCSLPSRIKNKLGLRRFLQACVSERDKFSVLHDYGRIEECQILRNLGIDVFAVPHTMNIENYNDEYFDDTPDCGISLLVQSKQGAAYFRQLGFHEIIECGQIDWSDISPSRIIHDKTGFDLLLLPKLHLGILDPLEFVRLIKKIRSNGSEAHCITHPNERLWGAVIYSLLCMVLGVRMTVGGVSGLKEGLPVKRIWCFYSDFVMAGVNQIEKVFVRHARKDKALRVFLPKGSEKHEQIWL